MSLFERQLTSTQSTQTQNPLIVLTGFEGLTKATSGNFIPPDTQVAVGPNDIMEMVNTHAKIWTKQGTPINDSKDISYMLLSSFHINDLVFEDSTVVLF